MDGSGISQIVSALEVLHASSSSNDQRRDAQNFLESLKENNDAPYWGWQLASSSNGHDNIVRHFGLTLLQHAINYSFSKYDEQKRSAIKLWVSELACQINEQDPHYIKEKISMQWVGIAKRIWGMAENSEEFNGTDGWQEMDEQLYNLWNQNTYTREFTLSVFRTIFEDLYILDDQVAAKRSTVLSAQCIEVVTSEADLQATYDDRLEALRKLKYGTDGWLNRWAGALADSLNQIQDASMEQFAVRLLETLKTCLYWVFPLAIRNANLLGLLSMALELNSVQVRTLATDCLHVLLTRNFNNNDDFQAIVGAVFDPAGMATLNRVYDSLVLEYDKYDEPMYILLKKMVEMIVGLGENLNVKSRLSKDADIAGFLSLVLKTTRHESLVISGFSLQFWCSVLRVTDVTGKKQVDEMLPHLLEAAAERCVRYEDVGEDHVSRRFLEFDFDSTQEIQGFLGNYRRFVEDIVRLVVCHIPYDSMIWLRQRMEQYFSTQDGWSCLGVPKLNYDANPIYYMAHSQFMVLDSALRGVLRWKIWYQGPDKDKIAPQLLAIIEDWCPKVVGMDVQDPMLKRKMIQCIVQFAPALKETQMTNLMFMVLEKVLTACTTKYPENATDEDKEVVRDLRTSCGTELNRLAYMIPNELMQIYDDLERVIGEVLMNNELSEHEIVAFKSFLLVVSQRSQMPNRAQKFATIVDPVLQSWSDEGTMKGLADLQWFMARVGIVKIAEYFRSRGVTANTDLLATKMDDAGRALKQELKASWSEIFPIRPTRIFIQYTIEKVSPSSDEFKDLLELWKPRIQPILPHILQLTAQIEAFHNPDNWVDLPPEVQSFVKYSTQERFWQAGVSTQTRDEFVEDNMMAMHTLRDFADSVGHIIRYTREYCFLTLGSISQLGDTLYEIPGMAQNLWQALAGDSTGITSHAWRHMVSLALRNIIKNCPPHYMRSFMLEFLPPMLSKFDEVLCSKWANVTQTGLQLEGGEDDESLSEEMMEEHLLRQLTAVVDRMLIDLAGQFGSKSPHKDRNTNDRVLHELLVEEKAILAPFLTICTHILGFKDVRCSFNCALVMRNLVPKILLKDSEVDQYLCESVMKTCLQVLQDPYFNDVHNEVGYVITTIYTVLRQRYDRPMEVLMELLPHVPQAEVDDFERRLAQTKSARQQRGVFLDFLTRMQGMAAANEGTDARERARQKAEKKNDKNKWLTNKKSQGGNIMDDENVESVLSNLFGEQ